ncbi:MAG: formylglycine-generating enzyme family protein [Spirochaetaceae bacterium]|nr:formylglycine-generating enzyme family protein [Spirochaetaceae bacterium]
MKKKLMLIFMIALVILIIGCENPWMKDLLDKMVKDKNKESLISMVWISAGTFIMGSPVGEDPLASDEDQHQVTLTRGFYMSKYQVTQEQYQAVMVSNPSNFTTSPEGNSNKLPVETVSWYDVIVFCNKLSIEERLNLVYTISGTTNPDGWGPIPTVANDATWDAVTVNWDANGYRLPTEAEWEYACRGGTTTAYSYGNTANPDYMWYNVNSNSSTHEVGKKLPNVWGLYDMHGNVFEWCWDWYDDYGGSVTDPKGPGTSSAYGAVRVVRGGCWDNDARNARSAFRAINLPWYRDDYFGFRLVRQ